MHLSLVDLERLADVLVEVLDVLVRERLASGGPGVEDAEVVHVDDDDEFRAVAGEDEAARVRLGLNEPRKRLVDGLDHVPPSVTCGWCAVEVADLAHHVLPLAGDGIDVAVLGLALEPLRHLAVPGLALPALRPGVRHGLVARDELHVLLRGHVEHGAGRAIADDAREGLGEVDAGPHQVAHDTAAPLAPAVGLPGGDLLQREDAHLGGAAHGLERAVLDEAEELGVICLVPHVAQLGVADVGDVLVVLGHDVVRHGHDLAVHARHVRDALVRGVAVDRRRWGCGRRSRPDAEGRGIGGEAGVEHVVVLARRDAAAAAGGARRRRTRCGRVDVAVVGRVWHDHHLLVEGQPPGVVVGGGEEDGVAAGHVVVERSLVRLVGHLVRGRKLRPRALDVRRGEVGGRSTVLDAVPELVDAEGRLRGGADVPLARTLGDDVLPAGRSARDAEEGRHLARG